MSHSIQRASLVLPLVLAVVSACSGGGSGPSPSPSPTPSPSPAGVVVTVRVADAETFRILLTKPDDIAVARDLLAGRQAPGIPNGRVIRGDPGVNAGYSWHLDPNDFEWADMAVEVCDGRPSDVERGAITSDRYCTWAARVIAVEPAT